MAKSAREGGHARAPRLKASRGALAMVSAAGLSIALCWSLVGGLIASGLFAWIYNPLAPLDARSSS